MKNTLTEERIKQIHNPKWINYPSSNQIINELENLLEFDQSHRPENLLIISETNNGKTIIAKRFLKKHEPKIILEADGNEKIIMDVLMIQCPYVADEKLFYFALLDALNVSYRSSKSSKELLTRVLDVLKRLRVKILILDEFQHLLSKPSKQRDILNLIKYISNEVGISFVGIGTKEAFYVINSDPQLANRFNKSMLPSWKYNNTFINLLATYQTHMDLQKEFNITEPKISKMIFEMGQGLLGEYVRIIKLLWKEAIVSGEEKITLETLKRIKYIPPSQRRDDKFLYE